MVVCEAGHGYFYGYGSFACGYADNPRQGAMPRCGNGGFSATVKVELRRQLGHVCGLVRLHVIITMASIKSTSRLLPTPATGTPAADEK